MIKDKVFFFYVRGFIGVLYLFFFVKKGEDRMVIWGFYYCSEFFDYLGGSVLMDLKELFRFFYRKEKMVILG